MSKTVLLSNKSQELIERCLALDGASKNSFSTLSSPVDARVLVTWLADDFSSSVSMANK